MKLSFAVVVAAGIVCCSAGAARAGRGVDPPPQVAADPARPWLIPPVDGAVGRRFQAPAVDWGPGHRGIDYLVPGGAPIAIRAAAGGRVSFAGSVAGVNAVTIEHSGGMETTYSNLLDVDVVAGQYVTEGAWIGHTRFAHRGTPGLHFGVKIDGVYVDPEDYLGPLDASEAIYLAPLVGRWARDLPWWRAGSYLDEGCHRTSSALLNDPPAPNGNLAVVVPGLSSKTAGGLDSRIFSVPGALGFGPEDTYLYSYRGADGPHLHEPYERADTYGDLRAAAGRLSTLLIRLGRRYPGRDVDVIAYSQGGVIARTALELSLRAWQPGMPRVEHLVTFASPHRGTKLAELPEELSSGTVTGRWLTDLVEHVSATGAPVPDPYSDAVEQLRPDSALIGSFGRQDVVFGTRVLSLAIPNDLVVPVERAVVDGAVNRVVPPEGLWGHAAITGSAIARRIAYDFLRDAPQPCETKWDHLSGPPSAAVDFIEDHAAEIYGELESEALLRRLRSVGPAADRLQGNG
jgi:Peptidase family M23/Putative serine esterase (DUF676)